MLQHMNPKTHKSYIRKTPSKPSLRPKQWIPQYRVPLSPSRQTGIIAENLVKSFLKYRGWQILTKNYGTKQGEIDIIASKMHADLKGYPTVIFIEVKSRRINHGLPPEQNVTLSKQKKISQTIKHWIAQHPKLRAVYRCDVASVWLEKNKLPRIKYIPSAFCVRQDFGW